jgi:maltooligosyltrehalose synthase
VWRETNLILPPNILADRFQDVFTGETVAVADARGRPVLAVGEIFRDFPVALLEGSGARQPSG